MFEWMMWEKKIPYTPKNNQIRWIKTLIKKNEKVISKNNRNKKLSKNFIFKINSFFEEHKKILINFPFLPDSKEVSDKQVINTHKNIFIENLKSSKEMIKEYLIKFKKGVK